MLLLLSSGIVLAQSLATLLKDMCINFVDLVLQKVANDLTNEVARLATLAKNFINEIVWKLCLDFSEVATTMRWPYY